MSHRIVTSFLRPCLRKPLRYHSGLYVRPKNIQAKIPTQRVRQASFQSGFRHTFFKNPVGTSFALALIAVGGGALIYVIYVYMVYIEPINKVYPAPVAQKLRRALFYTDAEPDIKRAVGYYRDALELANEHGMNPFSEEVLGIKTTLANALEKSGNHAKAIEVLERLKSDCLKWIEIYGGRTDMRPHRTRILKKVIGIEMKLGSIYSDSFVDDLSSAEHSFVNGVELTLKELRRREQEGEREGEGAWLTNEEIVSSLESLADHYEKKSEHGLSSPLYLRAVSLTPQSCHLAVLMNNLSISLAQSQPESTATIPTSRSVLISNARSWAQKALAVAKGIEPNDRNEECDLGCAVATHNLGEFAEMEGLVEEARLKYSEAESLSKQAGFAEGVQNAKAGLKRLEAR